MVPESSNTDGIFLTSRNGGKGLYNRLIIKYVGKAQRFWSRLNLIERIFPLKFSVIPDRRTASFYWALVMCEGLCK